jgi:hypothetical protein
LVVPSPRHPAWVFEKVAVTGFKKDLTEVFSIIWYYKIAYIQVWLSARYTKLIINIANP